MTNSEKLKLYESSIELLVEKMEADPDFPKEAIKEILKAVLNTAK